MEQIYKKNYLQARKSGILLSMILFVVLMIFAKPAYSQDGRIRISAETISTTQLFNEIEKQTRYKLAYGDSSLNLSKQNTLTSTNPTVKEVLIIALEGSGCSYRLVGNNVAIYKLERQAEEKPTTTAIKGIVVDNSTGAPIVLANVKILGSNISATTDHTGAFEINNLPIGNQNIRTSNEGYLVNEKGVNITADSHEVIEIRLKSLHATQPKVIAPSINSAIVTISDVEHLRKTVIEDSVVNIINIAPRLTLKSTIENSILLPYKTERASHGKFALKTNLLYWATMSPNIGGEIALSDKWSLELTAGINMFRFDGRTSLRHFLVKPEIRYWLCRPFEGHFFGVHAIYGQFAMGELPIFSGRIKDYSYEGSAYGGGLTYGYHWALGGRWGLEAAIGVGYLRLEYDELVLRQDCKDCYGRSSKNYFGPTKAGISLIYVIR